MRTLFIVLVNWIFLSASAHAGQNSDSDAGARCDPRWWKRDILSSHTAFYRGQLKTRSANRVHIEVRDRRNNLVATSAADTNSRGVFQIYVVASRRIKKGRNVVFRCATGGALAPIQQPPSLSRVFAGPGIVRVREQRRRARPRQRHDVPTVRQTPFGRPNEPRRKTARGVSSRDGHVGARPSGTHHLSNSSSGTHHLGPRD